MADQKIEIEDLSPTITQARTDLVPIQKPGGSSHKTPIADILGLLNTSDVGNVLASSEADDTVDDADEVVYLTSDTPKRAPLLGLISSVFKTTRMIANAIFQATTFRLKNAGGFSLIFGLSGLTADRTVTFPDRSLTVGMKKIAGVTLSGAAVDFAIPSGARRVLLAISGLSTNGTSVPVLRLSAGGVFETTNYLGSVALVTTSATAGANHTVSFILASSNGASASNSGTIELIRGENNEWTIRSNLGRTDTAAKYSSDGSKVLAGECDGLRLTTANGTEVFDAGTATLYVED